MTDNEIRRFLENETSCTPGPWGWGFIDESMVCLGTEGSQDGEGHVFSAYRCKACRKTPYDGDRHRCLWPTVMDAKLMVESRNNIRDLMEEVLVLRALTDTRREACPSP